MDINQVYDIILNEIKINELKNEIKNININNQIDYKNFIIGEIYINKDNINKDIRIINSFTNWKEEWDMPNRGDNYKYENEKEIKENIEIKINGKKIK